MKIAIAGYGVEGAASYQYWLGRGDSITILDERSDIVNTLPVDAEAILGGEAFSNLEVYDMVVRTAGLSPHKLQGSRAIWSSTNEFFAQCPAPIIGVTGTKGKGTTSSMIAAILRAAGKNVHLVGNIGTPALDILPKIEPDDIVVFELSSFQLWDLEYSPHVAVVLMIEPDHLDVHVSMDEYVAAKASIAINQTKQDVLVYNRNNQFSRQIAEQSPAEKIEYPYAIDKFTNSLQVPGVHNVENAAAAIAAVRGYVTDDDTIRRGLESFTGLPHRLKFVREVQGVKYYDDNYSSAPGSALAAANAFSAPEVFILGGYDKGVDLSSLAENIASRSNVKHVVLIGQTGTLLEGHLADCNFHSVTLLEGSPEMQKIVEAATSQAAAGDIVVMSPACASFDMFNNFSDRGDQFINAVEAL